jgi:cytochrome d ubiquinol oxidase subunit II
VVANLRGAHLIAFWCNGVAIAAYVAGMFIALYPNVLPSTVDPADSLTIAGASASDYSLTIITWVAVIMLPVVIGYQAWSFWVFRKRIARSDV